MTRLLSLQDGGDAPEQAGEPIRKRGKFQAEEDVVEEVTSKPLF